MINLTRMGVHSKQAWKKKMKDDLHIPKEQIRYAMKWKILDILAVVPKMELISKGVPFVCQMIENKFPNMTNDEKALGSFGRGHVVIEMIRHVERRALSSVCGLSSLVV